MLPRMGKGLSKPYGGYPSRSGKHPSVATTCPASTIRLSRAMRIAKERRIVLDSGGGPNKRSGAIGLDLRLVKGVDPTFSIYRLNVLGHNLSAPAKDAALRGSSLAQWAPQ